MSQPFLKKKIFGLKYLKRIIKAFDIIHPRLWHQYRTIIEKKRPHLFLKFTREKPFPIFVVLPHIFIRLIFIHYMNIFFKLTKNLNCSVPPGKYFIRRIKE